MLLNNPNGGLNEAELLNRIKAARAEPEPQEPTESEEAVSLQGEVAEEAAEEPVQELVQETVSEESDELEVDRPEELEASEESIYQIEGEEITLSELKALKEGSLRQADYTRKTQELSEQRKALEAKSGQIDALSSTLNDLVSDLKAQIDSDVESVDWDELADLDPSDFLKKKAAIERKQAKLKEAQDNKAKLLKDKQAEEANILFSKMPEWSKDNGEARQKDIDTALNYAAEVGFSTNELNNIADHRIFMMMIKAAKFDSLKSAQPALKKKVAQAPKVTPATKTAKRKVTKLEESKNRLRKTGSQRDAVDALKAYLTK